MHNCISKLEKKKMLLRKHFWRCMKYWSTKIFKFNTETFSSQDSFLEINSYNWWQVTQWLKSCPRNEWERGFSVPITALSCVCAWDLGLYLTSFFPSKICSIWIIRGIFRTLSNIQDWTFLRKWLNSWVISIW